MASAYSIQRNRQGWLDPTDQNFTLKALMFKQQKYDANQAKVQSVIEKYQSLQLARGVDKEYLNNRLQALINGVNQYGASDYSSNAVTQSIEYHIGQALDDNVMTAVQETAKIKAYQAEVAAIKEKKPELYNSLNEAYGISPAQEYLQNEEVGATIKGRLAYTPYQDIEGEVQKTLLEIQTKAKDGSYEYEVSPGKLAKVTVNGKSAAELREIALGLMGDKYNQQFTINTWGKYGGFKNIEGASEQVNSYYDNLVLAHDKDIEEYKSQLTGGKLSPENIKLTEDKIKALENQRLAIQNNKSRFAQDPVSGLVAMEKENVANRLGKSLGLLQVKSMEYKKDDYWFGMQNLNLATAEFNHRQANDAARLEFEMRKHEDEKQLKINELAIKAAKGEGDGGGDGNGEGGSSNSGNTWVNTNGVNDIEQGIASTNTQVVNDIVKTRNTLYNTGKQVIQTIADIAQGRTRGVDAETRAQATQLLNNYKAKYGISISDSKKLNEGQIDAFMNLYSRSDAYQDLNFLPGFGERSATGETAGKGGLKTTWSELKNQFQLKKANYEKARAFAQADERKTGQPKHFTENQYFKQYLNDAVAKLPNNQQFTRSMDKKTIGNLNSLLSATGKDVEGANIAAEGGAITFQLTSNGTVALRYQSKGKGDDKESIMMSTEVKEVPLETFKKFFPDAAAKINLSQKKPVYTFQNFGTQQFISPKVAFLDPHSKNFNAYQQETSSFVKDPQDLQFLTKDGTKQAFSSIVQRFPTPETKAIGSQMASILSDPNFSNKFRVVVQHAQSYNGSGKADVLVSIVDPQTKQNIITHNFGALEGADDLIKVSENQPQILYSKLVGNELLKTTNQSRTGLQLTEGLEKLLKYYGR